jgi:FdrA protein
LEGPLVIASVTGTEGDPQVYSRQVAALRAANVIVAGSNAEAAALAAAAIKA